MLNYIEVQPRRIFSMFVFKFHFDKFKCIMQNFYFRVQLANAKLTFYQLAINSHTF